MIKSVKHNRLSIVALGVCGHGFCSMKELRETFSYLPTPDELSAMINAENRQSSINNGSRRSNETSQTFCGGRKQ